MSGRHGHRIEVEAGYEDGSVNEMAQSVSGNDWLGHI